MFRRGEVLWINCDPSVGVEPKKTRTCVVVSAERANRVTVTVVPTNSWTREKAGYYFMVPLRPPRWTLPGTRLANCSRIHTYDTGRVVRHAGYVSPQALAEIGAALALYLDLVARDPLEVHESEAEYRLLLAAGAR